MFISSEIHHWVGSQLYCKMFWPNLLRCCTKPFFPQPSANLTLPSGSCSTHQIILTKLSYGWRSSPTFELQTNAVYSSCTVAVSLCSHTKMTPVLPPQGSVQSNKGCVCELLMCWAKGKKTCKIVGRRNSREAGQRCTCFVLLYHKLHARLQCVCMCVCAHASEACVSLLSSSTCNRITDNSVRTRLLM